MPYKLVYFNVKGRGQGLRYLTIDNDIKLEEEDVKFDQWPAIKPTTPLGQLPVLKDGSFELGQSNAILRYVAKKHGLYGSNDHEAALIDMINDQQEDIRVSYTTLIYTNYDNGKAAYIESIPAKLAPLEKFLTKNEKGAGFFVGKKISFADYTIFDILDNLLILSPTSLDGQPHLKAFHGRMASRPKIAEYRASERCKNMPINGNGKQ